MDDLSIPDLQSKMSRGELTAQSLVSLYLERIALLDRSGPCLNSIIELNPDAHSIAAELDAERLAGNTRGPLHGIPLLIKDNLDTADRMMTTAGSLALEGSHPKQDAFLVMKLREAGAIILGKTNLSEWANFRSTRSCSGWSSRGGQTRNPYALDRSPCGSSSGSAVAVSANLCAAAVGTETDGSIICPSQTCGIVGIKPTVGLISRSGIIPIAHSQDTAGPLARTVTDAAVLLGVLAGLDPRDPATSSVEDKKYSDYTPFLDKDGLKGTRIGVARNFFGFHPDVDSILESCLQALKAAGAELVDPCNLVGDQATGKNEHEVLLYEFKADLNAYLASLGPDAPVHTLDEVIAFNEREKARVMPFFGQERMLEAQKKGPLNEVGYLSALEMNHKRSREQGIDKLLKEHKLDAILTPSGGPAWLVDIVNGNCRVGGGSSLPAVAGYPVITVPAGFVRGLPVGISFLGTAWSEPVLIRLAYAFEQATMARRKPEFLESVRVEID
jgi:amidase